MKKKKTDTWGAIEFAGGGCKVGDASGIGSVQEDYK
jgi:hypothetical protein